MLGVSRWFRDGPLGDLEGRGLWPHSQQQSGHATRCKWGLGGLLTYNQYNAFLPVAFRRLSIGRHPPPVLPSPPLPFHCLETTAIKGPLGLSPFQVPLQLQVRVSRVTDLTRVCKSVPRRLVRIWWIISCLFSFPSWRDQIEIDSSMYRIYLWCTEIWLD